MFSMLHAPCKISRSNRPEELAIRFKLFKDRRMNLRLDLAAGRMTMGFTWASWRHFNIYIDYNK